MARDRSALSFRDSAGFVFERDGEVFRHVGRRYREHFDAMQSTGLQQALTERGLLLPHDVVDVPSPLPGDALLVLRPERVPFISYSYEWSVAQLRDAALLTLDVQQAALAHGMTLKDASASNVQFRGCIPIFIDTLSFEKARDGEPWTAYRQFCRHFLAPLAVAHYSGPATLRSLAAYGSGYSLAEASAQLPLRSWFRWSLATNVHAQAAMERRSTARQSDDPERLNSSRRMPRANLRALLDHLRSAIEHLGGASHPSWWEDYAATHGGSAAAAHKNSLVLEVVAATRPRVIWDLGANTGSLSSKCAATGVVTVALEQDPRCVETMYRAGRARADRYLLPLVQDLAHPSAGGGWAGRERQSLEQRGPADLLLALAVLHHLVLVDRVPLPLVAEYLYRLCVTAMIEFVPPDDPMFVRLSRRVEAEAHPYTEQLFEECFAQHFTIEARHPLDDSGRVLYRMTRR